MKKVSLVTGGAGFIGSHVAQHCLNMGHRVVVLDDLSGGFQDNLPNGVQFVNGSITDAQLVEQLFAQHQFNYVYHLAAYAAEGLSHFIRRFNYNNNLIGSINLINEAIKNNIECFVFTSSIAVYGTAQLPMNENTTPEPEDPYGVAKYAVELDLRTAQSMFGLPFIIFRPHNVYGEKQHIGDRYRNVIGIFMNQIIQGKPLTIFGDGSQTRAFSYIDDVAPYIAQSVANPQAYNQLFNIGADQPYTILELANAVTEAFGISANIQHLPARNEVVHAYASHDKARTILGAESGVDLKTGVQKMADWVQQIGSRQVTMFNNIEIAKNLPPSWQEVAK
ncbi:MAG: NAD-dependent epimerase/dehydratase family protein [Ardenticatenaceae bacterium]|nr:NAD-dependent epimerase/dehydratase family protein [Anaerolineales bacterium]MCB8938279.1 NAD-dependent epimerase/dehydratase family protein [Ardenticatenaceae bacterium]MCB8975644.1 NAD-dependent epimerase/dehydratase family protein [Ardenticatenaceae bacterium]